jgi:hypothetical protein
MNLEPWLGKVGLFAQKSKFYCFHVENKKSFHTNLLQQKVNKSEIIIFKQISVTLFKSNWHTYVISFAKFLSWEILPIPTKLEPWLSKMGLIAQKSKFY